jgi:hypothetical protein
MYMNILQLTQLQYQSHIMTRAGNVVGLIIGLSEGEFIVSCNTVL